MNKPEAPLAAHTAAHWEPSPNNLESFWMPFTPNRAFKKRPRLIARARDMHYYDMTGRAVLDGTAGLWCCNAGHCRPRIVEAIQRQAGELDFAPTFQFGHPKVFELAGRLAARLRRLVRPCPEPGAGGALQFGCPARGSSGGRLRRCIRGSPPGNALPEHRLSRGGGFSPPRSPTRPRRTVT